MTTVETPKLKDPTFDPHLQAAGERVKAAAEELVRLGIARPDGTRIRTDLPEDMQVSGFGIDFFNADDRAAALNNGFYRGVPRTVRSQVNRLFEAFIADHIERRVSCAFETTLRRGITFEQAAAARALEMHVERIKMRADLGGHSASKSVTARHLRVEHR